jgi:hypothetical protein
MYIFTYSTCRTVVCTFWYEYGWKLQLCHFVYLGDNYICVDIDYDLGIVCALDVQ